MIQIKFIHANEIVALETATNEFLRTVDSETVKDIKYDFEELVAIVQYDLIAEWKNRMCCECQYWDDGGEPTTSGLCHECGQRKRFNYPACKCFKDVRG